MTHKRVITHSFITSVLIYGIISFPANHYQSTTISPLINAKGIGPKHQWMRENVEMAIKTILIIKFEKSA